MGSLYRFSTSFSFSLKMFLSSPRVDSIFSRENWFSPSEVLSFATQAFSSVTVLSRRAHSFTSVSTFFTHSSATAFTLAYLSLMAATSASASLCVVIFWASASARSEGLERPSVEATSAWDSQGANSLMPVLYSAQNLTSSEKLSHSFLTFSCRSETYLVILFSSSLCAWASSGTFSPWGSSSSSAAVLALMISNLAAMSSWRSIVLATRSSGAILSEEFLMSSSSLVARIIQSLMLFRDPSKFLREVQKSSMTFTFSSNCPTTTSFSSRATISLAMIFFLSSGRVIPITSTLCLIWL